MKKAKSYLIILLLALCPLLGFAADSQSAPLPDDLLKLINSEENLEMLDQSTHLLSVTGFLLKFRMQMVHAPDHAKNKNLQPLFTTSSWLAWKKMMNESQMAPIFWSDFFTAGIAMFGPFTPESSINAFYNPWWDAVLMLRLAKKGSEDKADWCIEKFELISGEDFRGEKAQDLPSIESLFSKKGTLGVVWFTLYRDTLGVFNEQCQMNGAASEFMLGNGLRESSKLAVQVRGAARMAMLKELFGDHGVSVEMVSYLTTLRLATVAQVRDKQLFPDEQEFKMFALFSALGEKFRENMTVYGYWGTEKKRMYLFTNKINPKIAAMVYVYVGESRHFEWFDLSDSQKYLDAMEEK